MTRSEMFNVSFCEYTSVLPPGRNRHEAVVKRCDLYPAG